MLSFPLLQAPTVILAPLTAWMTLAAHAPIPVAMVALLPLYMVVLQVAVSVIGLYEFNRAYRRPTSLLSAIWIVLGYTPYQLLLGFAAVRACWGQLQGVTTWEKTAHIGAHRGLVLAPANAVVGA